MRLGGAIAAGGPYAESQAEIEGLRRALTEALDQQTATSEILRVIWLTDRRAAGL